MAITTRFATNTAMQYNEVDIDGFIINPSVGSRRFLTEAEQTRILRATETSALYFITDTSGTFYSARYRWYDSGGTMLNEYILSLDGAGVHNSIPVDWTSFYVPSGAVRLTVAIIGAVNGFDNGDFELGTGNLFTDWTLTQPTRTNLLTYSQEFDNAAWNKSANVSVISNSIVSPNGTTTADTSTNSSSVGVSIFRGTSTSAITQTASVFVKKGSNKYFGLTINGTNNFNSRYQGVFDLDLGILFTENNSSTPLTNRSAIIVNEENGWYRISVTASFNISADGFITLQHSNIAPTLVGDNLEWNNATIGTTYIWGAQLEQSAFATPYIPTTTTAVTTSLGEFLQDATGGVDGGRVLKMWVSPGGLTFIQQNVALVDSTNYVIRFWARVDKLYGNDYLTGPAAATLIDSTEWKLYEQTFSWLGTGTFPIGFDFTNDANYGFIYLDLVSVAPVTQPLLSENRTYLLDDTCVAYEYQLNWLNKLGGRDTWVMTGFPIETVEVKRANEIQYSARTNYISPNRIYGYRSNESRKSLTLTHQCKDRATAEWLKSELIDTIDIMVLIDGVYQPCDVVPNSIVVRNTFSQDYSVRVTLRFAYDINVQTR